MRITIDLKDDDWENCKKIISAIAKIESPTPFAFLTITIRESE